MSSADVHRLPAAIFGRASRIDPVRFGSPDALAAVAFAKPRRVGEARFPAATGPPPGPVIPAWVTHAWEAESLTLTAGDPVATWTDSVAGQSMAQTTPTARPLYGVPAQIQFDNVDDQLSWTTTALDAGLSAATYTWMVAAKFSGVGSGQLDLPLGLTTSSAVRGIALWIDDRTGQKRVAAAHNAAGAIQITAFAISALDTAWHTIAFVARGAGNQGSLYLDGVPVTYVARPPLSAGTASTSPVLFGSGGAFPADLDANGLFFAAGYSASDSEIADLHAYRVARGTL